MQDEVGVHMMQRQQDLHKEVQDGLLLQQGVAALLDELSQRAAWCIFHGDHEGLVLQEVLIVLNDIGVVEQLEDLALILGCLPLFLGHLLHRDLLDDHQLLVSLAQAQMNNPEGTSPHHSDPLVLLHLIFQSHLPSSIGAALKRRHTHTLEHQMISFLTSGIHVWGTIS